MYCKKNQWARATRATRPPRLEGFFARFINHAPDKARETGAWKEYNETGFGHATMTNQIVHT